MGVTYKGLVGREALEAFWADNEPPPLTKEQIDSIARIVAWSRGQANEP